MQGANRVSTPALHPSRPHSPVASLSSSLFAFSLLQLKPLILKSYFFDSKSIS
jgi:hypothetical protein